MMRKQLLTMGLGLGISIAAATVSFAAGWQQGENGNYWYEYEDGTYAKGMKQIDGKTYLFDENGYLKTGWNNYNWCWYYMDASGAVQTGWVEVGGQWFYFNGEGVMQVGFQTIGNDLFFLNYDTGAMVTGVFEFDGYRYQAGADGKIIRGKKDGNVKYDRDGKISYYNSNTHEWDYMPDSTDTADVVMKGLEKKYSEGKYYTNAQFESDAYQNLKTLLTEEEIAEFIDMVEDLNDDIYQRNEDRYNRYYY
ncbi:hypothetical protein [Clostridium sp. AM58-1XD]|uniref:hypothetical protein n=1 Tax=Clostridium sp. AM58-1XD TaxID=2292307 RepID=UPI0015F6C0A5|nr:hypothetical protein [Clostridium sp. AM58-1XD]